MRETDHIRTMSVQAKTVDLVEKAMEEVKRVIRKRHRNRDDFFEIWEMHRSMEELDKVSSIIKIMLGSIAGFSLLVGGHRYHEHDVSVGNRAQHERLDCEKHLVRNVEIFCSSFWLKPFLCVVSAGCWALGWVFLLGRVWRISL